MNTGRIRIGHGTYGIVYQTKHKRHGDIVMKWIDITDGYKHPLELDIMIRFNHPNIVRCLEYHPDKECNKDYISVIMEKGSSDLHKYRLKNGPLTYSTLHNIMFQCLSGLKALHDDDIIHLDIKSNNIIIFENNMNVKLIDFGMAKKLYHACPASKYGKIISEHNPPENANGSLKYDKCTDVWCMGMTFLFLIAGRFVSRHEIISTKQQTFDNILKQYTEQERSFILPLLNGMLAYDNTKRITVDDAMRLPIFDGRNHIPNNMTHSTINYGTYDVNDFDRGLFSSWFGYLSGLRPDSRTVCNIIEIYHRYMRIAQEKGTPESFQKNKAYTLTAATCIGFLLNEDIKLDSDNVYRSLVGYHLGIENDFKEIKEHIIIVNMSCQFDISRAPLHAYVCDKYFTSDNYYHILSSIHDPIEYSRCIERSPTNEALCKFIPHINYSLIKTK